MNNKQIDEVVIRKATLDDLDPIVRIEQVAFPKALRYSRELFHDRLSHHPDGIARIRQYFVAASKIDVVGYGEVAIETPSVALFYGSHDGNKNAVAEVVGKLGQEVGVLISLAVKPSARKKGLGALLTSARMDFAREAGMKHIFTHAWPNGGFPYIARSLAFTAIPAWSGHHYADGSQAVLYYKRL